MASPVLPRDIATPSASPPPRAEPEPQFPYGWRDEYETLPNGEIVWKQIPLTLEDVLYPKEGDTIPITKEHDKDVHRMKDWVSFQLRNDPTSLVLSDTLVRWGVPGLKDPSPDVSVFRGVNDRDRNFSLFDVAGEMAETLLTFEYVSPKTRVNDVVTKPADYHKAGVPIYVIVDQEKENGPRSLIGYHWTPAGYERMTLDRKGMLLLSPVNLKIRLRNNRLVGFDALTGEELGDFESAEESRRLAELTQKQAEEIRDRAAEARRLAELAQKQAEENRDREAEARRLAEEKLKELTERLRKLEQVLPPGEAQVDS